MRDYDRQGKNKINYQDFHEIATEMILQRDSRDEIHKAFKLFDDDESGKISLKKLRRVSRELGDNVNEEELKAMIDEFDLDGDGENKKMLNHQQLRSGSRKSKSKTLSKEKPTVLNNKPNDILENVSKPASLAVSSKQRSPQKTTTESIHDWSRSNDNIDAGDSRDNVNAPSVVRRRTRRAEEEIIATNIPTILSDDVDGESTIDMKPDVAAAPQFSTDPVASFKEIEKDFVRQRVSQYIDAKIDIGILHTELNLQEKFDDEELKPWNWDKIFVEIRNAITNSTIQ
ncbi:unnamed protein product [Rotaria magnacalcarata]|nr:unnamed protein product [Rotaria magnacalcarata]